MAAILRLGLARILADLAAGFANNGIAVRHFSLALKLALKLDVCFSVFGNER
jgi:hypothetical protein